MFEDFIKLKHQEKYSSNSTCIGDIEFYLEVYSQGGNQKDVVDVFISMSTINNKISKVETDIEDQLLLQYHLIQKVCQQMLSQVID